MAATVNPNKVFVEFVEAEWKGEKNGQIKSDKLLQAVEKLLWFSISSGCPWSNREIECEIGS